jgi:hypothetical protein
LAAFSEDETYIQNLTNIVEYVEDLAAALQKAEELTKKSSDMVYKIMQKIVDLNVEDLKKKERMKEVQRIINVVAAKKKEKEENT